MQSPTDARSDRSGIQNLDPQLGQHEYSETVLRKSGGNPLVTTVPESPPPHKGRSPRPFLLAGLGVMVVLGLGYHWWQYASTHEETDNATVTSHLHPVSTRIPGTVQQVLVVDNQLVHQGQVLVRLDRRDYVLKLQQAQTELEMLRRQAQTAQIRVHLSGQNATAAVTQVRGLHGSITAALEGAAAAVREAEAGIPKAQALLAEAEANLEKARLDYERFRSLFQSGAIARQQLETAQQVYEVAQGERVAQMEGVRQAQAKLTQAQQRVVTYEAGLQYAQGSFQLANAKQLQTAIDRSDWLRAQAAIAQAEVAVKNAQLQLSYTQVVAPTSGHIGHKAVEPGQQVQVGTPLMALVQSVSWITANFKETQLERMRPGQPVAIHLDSFPNHPFLGHVESVAPASGAQFALLPPDNATGNFTKIVQRIPVKIVFEPESIHGYESVIVPGMSATVSVELR
ncbi:secretion protein HlyD [Neosynechococcus sphagnicola sy1]|uniref:Secretion protein HlyD n=1 Tax=Neosynechococcus sphagnicola sy1 TaxID=1497020 RepID=A0A098TLT5_9CYAN|nr:HlyD family secretion protein [Neosynechococcus sphagnicola]KGF72832.1 secretion protein HlyD [Neosynechococcus sphagnicola sy1]